MLALLLGLTNTLDHPVRHAFTVEMVGGKEDLRNAIALNSALFSGARLVGPAVAGLLVARYGVGLVFFVDGVSFLAVIGALLVIKAEGLPQLRPKKPLMGASSTPIAPRSSFS